MRRKKRTLLWSAFPKEALWGELKIQSGKGPARKGNVYNGFAARHIPQNTAIYRLSSLRDILLVWRLGQSEPMSRHNQGDLLSQAK
jgi:hypothetical protein